MFIFFLFLSYQSEFTELENQQLFSISSQRDALEESSRNLSMKEFSPQV